MQTMVKATFTIIDDDSKAKRTEVIEMVYPMDDNRNFLKALIEYRQYGSNFNIGDKNEFSNIYVVKLICKYIDEIKSKESHLLSQYPISKMKIDSSAELISFVKDRKGHDFRYSIDSNNPLYFKNSI